MAKAKGDDKLICNHIGGWQWVDFELCRMGEGYGLLAACSPGDHWIAPDPAAAGRYVVCFDSHAWPTASAAIAARDAWRLQKRRG